MNPASSGKPIVSGKRLVDRSPNFINPGESVRPLRDQILLKVLPLPLGERIIADWGGEPVRGQVVATGPGRYPRIHARGKKDGKDWRTVRDSKAFRPTEVKIGQIVQVGGMEIDGYMFPKLLINNEEYIMISEQDIAIIEA